MCYLPKATFYVYFGFFFFGYIWIFGLFFYRTMHSQSEYYQLRPAVSGGGDVGGGQTVDADSSLPFWQRYLYDLPKPLDADMLAQGICVTTKSDLPSFRV